MQIVVEHTPNWAFKRWLDVRCISYCTVAEKTGICLNAFCKKINGEWPFTVGEVSVIADKLKMTGGIVLDLFFLEIEKTNEMVCQYISCPENCRDCHRYNSFVSRLPLY